MDNAQTEEQREAIKKELATLNMKVTMLLGAILEHDRQLTALHAAMEELAVIDPSDLTGLFGAHKATPLN